MDAAKPPHRFAVRFLIGLGTLLTVLAIFAVWAERQLLDTGEWVQTSSRVLQDDDVKSALSAYLTDELFSSVDVSAELSKKLPPAAKPLAGPAAAGLQQLAGDAALKALDSGTFQSAWANANRAAHTLLLNVIEGNGELVTSTGGVVTLQLRPLVAALATRLGISPSVADKLPPSVASLQILKSDQLSLAQDIVNLIRKLAIVLSVLALGSLALAIYLSRGRRQMTVFWCGFGLIVAGLLVYVIRHVGGNVVVDAVVTNDSARPAAEATWSIATSLMHSIATTVIIFGVLFVIASWLASPTASGRAARRAGAPILREHPAALYSLVVAVALIYFALAPTHGLRALVTVAILAGLAALGLASLRRQAAAEFPDAQMGDTSARLRAAIAERRHHAPAQPAAAGEADDRLSRLERLAKLREQGVLSDEEFAAEKARTLGREG